MPHTWFSCRQRKAKTRRQYSLKDPAATLFEFKSWSIKLTVTSEKLRDALKKVSLYKFNEELKKEVRILKKR